MKDIREAIEANALLLLRNLNESDLIELKDYEFDEDVEAKWLQFGVFADNILNISESGDNHYYRTICAYMLSQDVKGLGFHSCAYNYIGKGKIPTHVDNDLCAELVSVRAFIPVLKTSSFKFSGYVYDLDSTGELEGKEAEYREIEILEGQDAISILLDPNKPHSFEQLNDNGHYLICDCFRENASSEYKMNYLSYALKTYL